MRATVMSLLVVMAICAAPTTSAAQGMPLDRLEVERLALERHPMLREAAARVEEARGLARQAGAMRNPVVGATADDLATGDGRTAGKWGGFISQDFALGGRLGAARAAGDALTARREAEEVAARQEVLADVRERWVRLLIAGRTVAVDEGLATLAEESVDIANKLYNVGLIDRADVLDAEAALAEAVAHRAAARADVEAAWLRLEVVTGPLDRTRIPQAIEVPVVTREGVIALARERAPEVVVARRELERQRALLAAADRSASPDLELKAEGWFDRERRTSGAAKGWGFGAEAGLRLPLWNRFDGQKAAADAAVRAAEAGLAVASASIEDAVTDAWADYEATRVRAAALEANVLPRAEEAYRLYLENFQTMSSPYPQVLMSRERIMRVRLEYLEALDAGWHAWIRLARLGAPDGPPQE